MFAPNASGAGSLTLWPRLLDSLVRAMPETDFAAVLPRARQFETQAIASMARVNYRVTRKGVLNDLQRAWDVTCGFALALRRMRADALLCIDLPPAFSPCPVVVFLNQPLLVYDRRELGGQDSWHRLKRRVLLWLFSRASRRCHLVVQTPVMAERVKRAFGLRCEQVSVIPPPLLRVPSCNRGENDAPRQIRDSPKPIRLLFLSAYYAHKNHAILPAVTAELRRQGLAERVHVFTTLGVGDLKVTRVAEGLNGCEDIVTNLGTLSPGEAAGALRAATALFLPTLAESCGLPYLEAMAMGRTVLTSDRDFARWMCGPLAVYFDPTSAPSIVGTIAAIDFQQAALAGQEAAVHAHLSRFSGSWDEVAGCIATVLREEMKP